LTGLFLTAYTGLLVGFRESLAAIRPSPLLLGAPIAFLVMSLIVGFGTAVMAPHFELVLVTSRAQSACTRRLRRQGGCSS